MDLTRVKPDGRNRGFDMTLPELLRATREHFGLTEKQIFGTSRHPDVVYARSIMIFIMRYGLKMSLTMIGKAMKRHHTTIMSTIAKIVPEIADAESIAFTDAKAIYRRMLEAGRMPVINSFVAGVLFQPLRDVPRA